MTNPNENPKNFPSQRKQRVNNNAEVRRDRRERLDSPPRRQKRNLPMKKHLTTIILLAILLVGISLILYPTVASYWNSLHQSRAISQYTELVEDLEEEDYTAIWEAARAYNEALAKTPTHFTLSDEEEAEYESQLSLDSNGIMGYIEIPTIDVYLPIYHGTDETTLQSGVGHLSGSSLPVGGESSHCVLSGHRGLSSSKLFTDLNKLSEGDTFLLHVLDETLTYEVDQILIVEPSQIDSLAITEDEDYCTLVTCTPYGINTHRLLVRGHRVENQVETTVEKRVVANAVQVDTTLVASIVAVPLLIIMTVILLFVPFGRKRKIKNDQAQDEQKKKAQKPRRMK
jgi:sortase A